MAASLAKRFRFCTVARALGTLVEANVVKRRSKTLHIFDPERLKALVDAT